MEQAIQTPFDFELQDANTLVLCRLDNAPKPKQVQHNHYCSCKAVSIGYCANCGAWLCRNHLFRWHQGLDYCLLHLPNNLDNQLGSISVDSVRYYDITDGVYIGRGVITSKDDYPNSLLANPYKLGKNPSDEDKKRCLANYRLWLNEHRLAKDEVYAHLLDLRDIVLRGLDLRLLCWCKSAEGDGICHGDIVRDCLNWMIGQVRK